MSDCRLLARNRNSDDILLPVSRSSSIVRNENGMRLRTKWIIFSAGGGVLVFALLAVFPDALDAMPVDAFPLILAEVLLWPVIVCEYLVPMTPNIGSPSHPIHEATPLNIVAAMIGVALSWVFWSSLVVTVIGFRQRRGPQQVR